MTSKNDLITALRQIQVKFSRFYIVILEKLGLTLPQYALLGLLAEEGAIAMSEAGSKLHITKSAVTHLTDQLEYKKCLIRQPQKEDRRVILLKILPNGEEKVRETQTRVLRDLLNTFDQFSSGEQEVISRFYSELTRHLDKTLLTEENHES